MPAMTDNTPDQSDTEGRGDALVRNLGLMRERADAYYRRGLQTFDAGDIHNAILDLSEAIYYDRGYAEYYSTRGLFYATNMQVDEARLDLNYALKLSKRQWLAHYVLGTLDFEDGNYQSAIKHFDEAQRFSLHRPEIWYHRAVAHYKAGNVQKAGEDMHRAVQLFPADDKRRKDAQAWLKEIKANSGK